MSASLITTTEPSGSIVLVEGPTRTLNAVEMDAAICRERITNIIAFLQSAGAPTSTGKLSLWLAHESQRIYARGLVNMLR